MLDSLVRVVYEYQEDGPRRLRTSGLASFIAAFGEDLLVQYCRCYIHSDRLESLVSMLHSSLEKQGTKSAASFRLYLTFQTFVVGTLFETVTALNALREALESRGIFDETEWKNGPQKWLEWSYRTSWAGKVRKKAAFHVDPDWIREGLAALAQGDPGYSIIVADSQKARDSYMQLAHEAMLAGAGVAQADILDALDAESELELVGLKDKVNLSFLAALKRLGLEPIPMKSNRVVSLGEEARRPKDET